MNLPLLGVDVGRSRTGIAISESGIITSPLTTIESHPPHYSQTVDEVLKIAFEYEAATLVVGIPLHRDGSMSPQAVHVQTFMRQLTSKLTERLPNCSIVEIDEHGSTQLGAQEFPQAPGDAAAAAVILQNYIDSIAS